MGTPTLELNEDHVRVRLDRMASVTALTGGVVIPYSTLASVDVVRPEWPPFLPAWRVGLHVPGVVARGRFRASFRGPQRFLWFDRRTARVLRLRLAGHPDYAEVSLDLPDAEETAMRIEARRGKR